MVEPAKAIEPVSTESGDRQRLEEGLAAVSGGGGGGLVPTGPPEGGGLTVPENPLGALTSGEVPGDESRCRGRVFCD